MSLPDESPRASVANLIGRFETHSKRNSQSGAISVSSRSSSVVSQTSTNGDSSKADMKDKREWPPKSVSQQQEKPAFALPSYLRPSVNSLAGTVASSLASAQSGAAGGPGKTGPSPPSSDTDAPAPDVETPTPVALSRSDSRATLNAEPRGKPGATPVDVAAAPEVADEADPRTPKPGVIQRKASTLTVTPANAKASGKTPTTAKPASKLPTAGGLSKTSAPPKTPAKTPAKSKTLTPASSMQSLRPQHTGQSTASTSGAGRKLASTSKPPVPSTPSRTKTASKPAATPSRTKSPVLALTRAKTPSSGLYAPTAASLARSRTAQEALPPPPVKKVLSSDVAERLSKPTAASLSKARTPTAAASPRPSGVGATPIKRTATTPATPLKASPGTPARTSVAAKKPSSTPVAKKSARTPSKAASGAGAVVAVAAAAAVTAASEEPEQKLVEPEKPVTPELAQPSPESASEQPADPVTEPEADAIVSDEQAAPNGHGPEEVEPKDDVATESAESTTSELQDTNETSAGDDIENIVNMLEGKSTVPTTVNATGNNAATADALAEIPDEE